MPIFVQLSKMGLGSLTKEKYSPKSDTTRTSSAWHCEAQKLPHPLVSVPLLLIFVSPYVAHGNTTFASWHAHYFCLLPCFSHFRARKHPSRSCLL